MPKFYKLHALIDVETKEVVDLRVTKDRCHDNRKFLPIVGESASKGDTVYADGAYDAKDNFSLPSLSRSTAAQRPFIFPRKSFLSRSAKSDS